MVYIKWQSHVWSKFAIKDGKSDNPIKINVDNSFMYEQLILEYQEF